MKCPGCQREGTLYVSEEYELDRQSSMTVRAVLTPFLSCGQCDLHVKGEYRTSPTAWFDLRGFFDGELDIEAAEVAAE